MLLLSDSCHDCINVETVRETLGLGSRVVLNPVGLKKGSFSHLWINTADFCSSLWICTAEKLNKQYEHGGWSDLVQGGMEVFVSPVSSGLVKEDSASTFNI